jgi:hypothetical protein
MPKEKSEYSKYYAPRPGKKPPKEKQEKGKKSSYKHNYKSGYTRGPEQSEEVVEEMLRDGVDAVFAKLREAGEDDRNIILSGLVDMPSWSNVGHMCIVFPPDYREREHEKCILVYDCPVDYNYNEYEDVDPEAMDLMHVKSAMAYYWGTVHVDSGEASDTYEGRQCRSRMEQSWDGGPWLGLSWERKDEEGSRVTYTGPAKARAVGTAKVREDQIETSYNPNRE